MLETGMDRFHFSPFMACVLACAGALPASPATSAPLEWPVPGVVVQLRPGVVADDALPATSSLRDTPQARREQAQAAWMRVKLAEAGIDIKALLRGDLTTTSQTFGTCGRDW